MEYFIEEKGMSIEVQKKRNLISSIRIGKVTDVLYEKKPSILPFSGKLPLVDYNDVKTFLDRTMASNNFDELPEDIKLITRKAEQIKWVDLEFRKFLEEKGIGENQFNSKNPKTKQDILYEWLFANKMDIGILNL